MNHKVTLTITALLTILFSTFHLADDVVRGIEPGGTSNYIGILIVAVFLYATLMLGDRRWAHVIVLMLIDRLRGGPVPAHDRVRTGRDQESSTPARSFSGSGRFSRSARPRSFPSSSRRSACG